MTENKNRWQSKAFWGLLALAIIIRGLIVLSPNSIQDKWQWPLETIIDPGSQIEINKLVPGYDWRIWAGKNIKVDHGLSPQPARNQALSWPVQIKSQVSNPGPEPAKLSLLIGQVQNSFLVYGSVVLLAFVCLGLIIKNTALIWLVPLAISSFLFFSTQEGYPHSLDEICYLRQAEILSQGELRLPAAKEDLVVLPKFCKVIDGQSALPYMPGYALMLAPFKAINFTFLSQLLALVILTGLILKICRHHQIPDLIPAFVLINSPFLLFNSASFFNHLWSVCWALLSFYLLAYSSFKHRKLSAGLAWGMVLMIRPVDALVFLVFLGAVLLIKRSSLKQAGLFALGLLIGGIGLLTWNQLYTGDLWLLPRAYHIGTQVLVERNIQQSVDHVAGTIINLKHLIKQGWLWFGAGFGIFLCLGRRHPWFWPIVFYALLHIVAYCFYYSLGGRQFGPRYWFSFYPFLMILACQGLHQIWLGFAHHKLKILLLGTALSLSWISVWPTWKIQADERAIGQEALQLIKTWPSDKNIVCQIKAAVGSIYPQELVRNSLELNDLPIIGCRDYDPKTTLQWRDRPTCFFSFDALTGTWFWQDPTGKVMEKEAQFYDKP